MTDIANVQPSEPPTSQLWPIGWGLIVAGLFGPGVTDRILASATEGSLLRLFLLLATDLVRLLFFIGLTFVIIGGLRNRRWRKEWHLKRALTNQVVA